MVRYSKTGKRVNVNKKFKVEKEEIWYICRSRLLKAERKRKRKSRTKVVELNSNTIRFKFIWNVHL